MRLLLTDRHILLALYCLSHILAASAQANFPLGYCHLTPTEWGTPFKISGNVTFQAVDFRTIQVTANIRASLPNGFYSMSVYEFGDITDPQGLATGNTFRGIGGANHSCPPYPRRREGDMGNWTLTDGVINMSQKFTLMSLTSPVSSVIGLSTVLRQRPDNCSGVDGFAGNRLAQCVIGIANQVDNQAAYGDVVNSAICSLHATTDPYCKDKKCNGTVWFSFNQQANAWTVTAKVTGLQKGNAYGFHIHQYGDLSSGDGLSAGAHFNPNNHLHNVPATIPRHTGDLGSIQSYDTDGTAWYQYTDPNLGEDISNLIGRGVVIHSGYDHGAGANCDQTGNAGTRIMMCVIGLSDHVSPPALPKGLVINNSWKSAPCGSVEEDDGTDGKVVAIVIGWILAVFFFFTTVGVAACWYARTKKDYRSIGDDEDDEDFKSRYRRRYGRY